jgi:hypothetical protein
MNERSTVMGTGLISVDSYVYVIQVFGHCLRVGLKSPPVNITLKPSTVLLFTCQVSGRRLLDIP